MCPVMSEVAEECSADPRSRRRKSNSPSASKGLQDSLCSKGVSRGIFDLSLRSIIHLLHLRKKVESRIGVITNEPRTIRLDW